MKRSTDRILTSHAGSLPRPAELLEVSAAKVAGQAVDERLYEERLARAVDWVAKRQARCGIDVINDGEYGKAARGAVDYGAWASYAWGRLSGWVPGEPRRSPAMVGRRDRELFKEFYAELDSTSFVSSNASTARLPVVTGPIKYVGQAAVRADIAHFKAATEGLDIAEGFITAVGPGSFGRRQNEYYKTEEEYLFALGEALREEYQAIVEAGIVLQIDDPGLPDNWDMTNPEPRMADYRRYARLRLEALNHALRGLPAEMIRYHICWGSWHGPHFTDLPLRDIADLLLSVHCGGFSVEAANVRHEHEWKVWKEVELPADKVLLPGVVGHATNVIEHPELVADRILRFAGVVGRERVIAATDCGLGGRIHHELVWPKLDSLVAGARIASQELWGK